MKRVTGKRNKEPGTGEGKAEERSKSEQVLGGDRGVRAWGMMGGKA